MAKTFTKRKIAPLEQVKIENLVDNRDGALEQFNGNLDSTQIKTINKFDLEDPANGTTTVGNVDKQTTILPTQTLAFSRRDYRNTGGAVTDIWTRIAGLNLETDVWQKGWNDLTTFGTEWINFPLQMECEEGILTGEATIDWEHGNQQFNVSIGDGLNASRARGCDWWTEWGIFVNGILVARSGYIYPRRHTTRIPFSIPVGSQSVTIDCRVVMNNWQPSGYGGSGKWSADFNLFSATIVARNIKR